MGSSRDESTLSPYSSIVVPVDQSDSAKKAIDYALRLAKATQAKLTIISVMERIPATTGTYIGVAELENSIENDLSKYVSSLVKLAEENGLNAQGLVRKGHPVKVILDVAKSEAADLIVMGSRGQGAFKEMLLGSVSHGVISHANMPVLIVK